MEIAGHIVQVEAYTNVRDEEKIRVTVAYQAANIMGTLTVDLPSAEAREYYVGRDVAIRVAPRG